MTEDNQMTDEQRMMDALAEAHYRWAMFTEATDPVTQASRLVEFNDAFFDLSTYHPTFDRHTDTLGWERRSD